jgi:ribosomal protein S18 acetylase RimI-like enzyme
MRPLNILRDLPGVADLIEFCFAATMDAEGRSYVDQMRRNGRDSSFLGWASKVIDSTSLPLSGFVWEDHGLIVGNVSLIPFFKGGRKIYLIANVATHPEYRRRGIARVLTEAAMQRAREKQAGAIWLHVREENKGAIALYHEVNFQERARRTNWVATAGAVSNLVTPGRLEITPRPGRDWPAQRQWLGRAYPEEVNWYSPKNWDTFQPGLFSSLYRFMADINTLQWSAYRDGALQGVLACQRTYGRADVLWPAFPAHPDQDSLAGLLFYARRMLANSHGVALEYPAGIADAAIGAAGFTPQRTLIWMEAPGAGR